MTSPRYFVDGVELVNTGGERCAACDRPAVGASISGHLVCARHAGWAAREAAEMAREKQESEARRNARHDHAIERVRAATLRIAASVDTREQVRLARVKAANHAKAGNAPVFACGHPRSKVNTYRSPQGRRGCRQCRAAHNQKRNAKRPSRAKENRGRAGSDTYVIAS